ncbi:MAG: hypothetical protein ACP5NS_04255 [Candidatus Pacearchaeota archaeon]
MNRSQKIVVTLLVISVILSLISVVINLVVLNVDSDSKYPQFISSGSEGSGRIELVVESAPSVTNGG